MDDTLDGAQRNHKGTFAEAQHEERGRALLGRNATFSKRRTVEGVLSIQMIFTAQVFILIILGSFAIMFASLAIALVASLFK